MPKRESCASILLAPRPPSRSPPTYDPHSTRCTAGCHTSRDFVHWRFLDAGELSLRTVSLLPASKNQNRCGHRPLRIPAECEEPQGSTLPYVRRSDLLSGVCSGTLSPSRWPPGGVTCPRPLAEPTLVVRASRATAHSHLGGRRGWL
jgi:hypothetical protein